MPEDTSVSDLLPLVAAVFNDKAAADASKELQIAREERDASRRIEVIRSRNNGDGGVDEGEDEEVVVYASGMFEDGQYSHNPNLWVVKMHNKSNNVCRLADLRDCHVCAGGGFPVASFGDNLLNINLFQGSIDGDERNGGGETPSDACSISFSFIPHTVWVIFLIHGWPREQWEQVIQNNNLDADNVHDFLVDTVAVQFPDTTIEFTEIAFVTSSIHGALKRLLPLNRKKEVRAERDRREREADPFFEEILYFVMSTMRERGNVAVGPIFLSQLKSVLGTLPAMGVDRLEGNEDLIVTAIEAQEREGDEGLHELVQQFDREVEDEEDNNELSERIESENDSDEDDENNEEETSNDNY